MLNIFLAFITPKFAPLNDDFDNDGDISNEVPMLPTKGDEEFRPFVRRMPEFIFWHSFTRALVISLVCTLFGFLDIPVFWPILLIYFIILFVATMKRQIRHMIRHQYVPFTTGKKIYG